MKRLILTLLLALTPVVASAQTVLTPADFTLAGSYDVQTNGNDTTYMRSLTHRYVNGQLRFLTLTHTCQLQEFALPAAFGQKVTTTTASWNICAVAGDFTGIWWEEAKQRLWVTASIDYGDAGTYYPTRISTLTLGANGAVSNVKTVSLQGITSKRLYGGVQPVPAWAQTALRCGPYVVGFGGYTSLAAQASRAPMGPSLVCIPDISSYANGAVIPKSAFKVLLDTPTNARGVRATFPDNFYDGRPIQAIPATGAKPPSSFEWLSPNRQGLGWFVWGDSYYNTGMWIDTPTARGYVAIAALCKGKCYYWTSTLNSDARTQEIHIWNPATLGNGLQTRPTSMAELALPRGPTVTWQGDVPTANISGATFDATTHTAYLVGYPLGADVYTGRLYALKVAAGTPVPTPVPGPQ